MGNIDLPRIGIVTPSYNQGGFIRETIDSVLGQQYPKLDYWVIDGGSSDETLDILKGYGQKINWVSEEDEGQTQAINKGLRRVTGDIMAFINSDDIYSPGTLSLVADYFLEHPEAMWLTGDHRIIDGSGKRVQSYVVGYKWMLRRRPSFSRLAVANYIVQPSTFWRRELVEEIGFFDESLRYCFDYDFWIRAIQKHPLHTLDNKLSLFRIHGASKGGSQFEKQFAEEHQVLKRYTANKALLCIHRVHAMLIVLAYRIVKR